MNTLILRYMTPALIVISSIFAFLILLRGHNAPGGGFIGGLIAAAAVIIASFTISARRISEKLPLTPLTAGAAGLLLAALSGIPGILAGAPFLTGLWWYPFGQGGTALSTPLLFDIGVWLVVTSIVAAVALELERTRDAATHQAASDSVADHRTEDEYYLIMTDDPY